MTTGLTSPSSQLQSVHPNCTRWLEAFVDEYAGKGLGETLHRTGFCDEVDWVERGRRIQPGTDDDLWIPPI